MSTVDVKAKGSKVDIVDIEETVVGTTPTTGTVNKVNLGAETLDSMLPTEFDSDISSSGGKKGVVRGLRTVSGGFSVQLESGAYDRYLRSLARRKAFTTDSYSFTDAVGSGDGLTCTLTGTSLENAIVGSPIKFSSWTNATMNDIFRIVSTSATTMVIGKIRTDQDFTGISLSTETATGVQTYVKNQGDNPVSFTFEKRSSQINTENAFARLKGVQVNSATFTTAPGGASGISLDFKGLTRAYANDGIVGPADWLVNGAVVSGNPTIAIDTGATDPQAGDEFYIEGDESNTKYTVVSYSAPNLTFSPSLGADVEDDDKIFFSRPGTEAGSGQKMENNLAYIVIDGTTICLSSSNIAITPNLEDINCVGSESAVELGEGERSVTGTLVPYFSSNIQNLLAKIRAFTRFHISIYFQDLDNNVICVHIPQAVADEEMFKRNGAGVIPQNIPFKAEESDTYGVNAIISVLNA